jgi:hypothetical protein
MRKPKNGGGGAGLVQAPVEEEPAIPPSLLFPPRAEQDEDQEDADPAEEADLDAEPAPAPPTSAPAKPGAPRVIKAPRQSEGAAFARAERAEEDRALREWLEALAAQYAVRVRVARRSPMRWKGRDVAGILATYEHPIDEDFLRETHGGGDYEIRVMRPGPNGAGWRYAAQRTIKIVGDPRLDDVYRDTDDKAPPAPQANDQVVNRAFSLVEKQLADLRERSHGPDPDALRSVTAPLYQQLQEERRATRELQQQLMAQQTARPPHDEFRDRMIDKLLDGDSARIQATRAQYESEIRMLKEAGIADQNRLHDRHERDRAAMLQAHEREISILRSSYDAKTLAVETAAATTRQLLEGEVRRLEGALTEARAELGALRAKKDKSVLEQLQEVNAIKEALGADEDKTPEKGTMEKIAEVVGNLPVVNALAQKYAGVGGDGPGPAPAAPPPPQRTRRVRGPDGSIYVALPDGRLQLVAQAPPRRIQAPAVAASVAESPASAEASVQPEPPIPQINPATVKIAVDYLEAAYRNTHDPDQVATSVRSMVPAEVMAAIKQLGVDGFLTKVARIGDDSPLGTQAGRNWARKLGRSLLGG